VRGVPTAHAAPPLAADFIAAIAYVWPSAQGLVRPTAPDELTGGAMSMLLQIVQATLIFGLYTLARHHEVNFRLNYATGLTASGTSEASP
jgi:hypothetical protein